MNEAEQPDPAVVDEIRALLGPSMTDRGVWAWLQSPSAYLGGRCPADVLRDPGGIDRVIAAAGAYAAGDPT